MKEFVAAGVQFVCTPNNVEANINKGLDWLPKALDVNAELIVYPETITTGFTTGLSKEGLWDLVDVAGGKITYEIQNAAAKYGVYIVWPSYERGEERGVVYNSAFLIDRTGKIIGTYRKTHPFPGEHVDYGNWTTPGKTAEAYDTDLGKIGMIICYDGDFPDLSTTIALKGAEIIVRPAAFLRTYEHWWATSFGRAYDNHVYMIAVNSVGPDAAGFQYFGHSMILGPNGWKYGQARCSQEIVYAKLTPDGFKNVYGGMTAIQTFDHMEDRNLECYDVMKKTKSSLEPGLRAVKKSK